MTRKPHWSPGRLYSPSPERTTHVEFTDAIPAARHTPGEAGNHPQQPLDAVLLVADLADRVRHGLHHVHRQHPVGDYPARLEVDGRQGTDGREKHGLPVGCHEPAYQVTRPRAGSDR